MSLLTPPLLVALAVAVPPLAAGLLFWPAARGLIRHLVPLTALPALWLALSGDDGGGLPLPWFFLGAELALDATGRLFLLFTAWLWLIAGWFAGGYLAADRRAHHFLFYFLLAQTGNFGLILAQDLVTFNVFFTLMGLAAYGLVIHRRDEAARQAGRVYLALVLLGEVLIFVGLMGLVFNAGGAVALATVTAAGPPAGGFIFLLLFGFGVKAGLLPLHGWLPLAHPAAPVPASAVLSGAMIKAGLLGWLRLLAPPASTQAVAPAPVEWGLLCLLLGLTAAFYGAGMGLSRQEPKSVLAWSSISQMGLLTAALGLGLGRPEIYPQALATIKLWALHHGLAKGALFLAVALVAVKISGAGGEKTDPSGPSGQSWWQQRSLFSLLLAGAVLLPALSLAGAPFTSGLLAKEQLLALGQTALAASPNAAPLLERTPWALPWPIPWPTLWELLLKLSSLVTTLLLLRFLALLRQQWRRNHAPAAATTRSKPPPSPQGNVKVVGGGPGVGGAKPDDGSFSAGILPAPWRLWLPWALLVLSGLPLSWPLLMPGITALLPATDLAPTAGKIFDALLPIILALLLAWRLAPSWPTRLARQVPPSAAVRRLETSWSAVTRHRAQLLGAITGLWAAGHRRLATGWHGPAEWLEERLGRWPLAGCSCLLLILGLFYCLL